MRSNGPAVAAVALVSIGARVLGGCKESRAYPAQNLPDELYATFETSKGDIVVKLFPKDAPNTVANFVHLATGEKEWIDPGSHRKSHRPLYDGTLFHRVLPGFMIQGGDPLGRGSGGPGYRFADELGSRRTFDKPGLLAMANSGPNTNGSQFFITTSSPHRLDGHHTIFAEVISGYEVAEAISRVPRGPGDRPVQPVTLKAVKVSEKRP